MSSTELLNSQINQAGYRTALAAFILTIISLFFVYDAPAGSNTAEKIIWLNENSGMFIAGWIVQILLMLSLSAVFAATAWTVYHKAPLSAVLAIGAVAMAVMAFLLNKFSEIWSVPLIAQDIAAGGEGRETAVMLLKMHSQSFPYTYTQSLDYLGFWLYAIFGLFTARHLLSLSLSAKIAGVCFGAYGIIFHIFYFMAVAGSIPQPELIGYLSGFALLIWIGAFAMGFYYRGLVKNGIG